MSVRRKWIVRSGKNQVKIYRKKNKFGRVGRAIGNYRFNRKYKKGKAVEGVDFY